MATGALKDGDVRFARGMDSVTDPVTLPEESYTISTNMLNRGGALASRPGFRVLHTLPPGKLQKFTVYKPRVGAQSLIAIVDGVPYASSFPFNTYREIDGSRLSDTATKAYHAQTTKAVSRNADGSLTVQQPQSLLILQDGVNPAIYYDGQKTTAAPGIPQGTHMAWSGARLWVARREQLFAGDIADPLSFYETTYNTLGGQNYFILPGLCSGLTPLPSSSAVKTPLLAFTDTTTSMFRSNVLARDSWPTIEDFQSELFPDIGCVADRSMISNAGMLWWFSAFGQVKLDSAANSYVTSKTDYIDREMTRSAKGLDDDLSGIAACAYENFILTSVPHASKLNRHTWVYDGSTNDTKDPGTTLPSAWASIWTGINPVEWTKVVVNGTTKIFCASTDDDGQNRVYEAFIEERRDNGIDFPWSFETRNYSAQTIQRKHFRYLEYILSEVSGQVNLRISWSGGDRGRWKAFSTPTFFAKEGNIEADRVYLENDPLYALKKQTRKERTEDVRDMEEDSLTSSGIEGHVSATEIEKEAVDTSFAIRFEGSGPCAVRAIRLFMDLESEPDSGADVPSELDNHFVRFDGAAAKSEAPLQAVPEVFTASATERAQTGNTAATATATVTSSISQADATKRASQVARERAEAQLRRIVAYYVP